MHIDHVNICAPPDLLRKVRDFYCEVLGLTLGFRPAFSKPGYWLYSKDKPIIHLVESDGHFRSEKQGYFDHFALQSTGLAGVMEKLRASGTSFRLSYLPEVNLSQVFCRDPAGIRVELNFRDETL